MSNCENLVKEIIFEEFSNVINTIKKDIKSNYLKKKQNPFNSIIPDDVLAYMAFSVSYASKTGYAFENCARRFAEIRYGKENVPAIVNLGNIENNFKSETNGQFIITNVNINDGNLIGEITSFVKNNCGSKRKKINCKVTQDSIKSLIDISEKYKNGDTYYTKPVDLAFFDGKNWNIFELKGGGNLDSSNSIYNVIKLLTIYSGMSIRNNNAYFACQYNKDEGKKTWVGGVKKYLNYSEMILIGDVFWNKVLPKSITYNKFLSLYNSSLEKFEIDKIVRSVIG